MDAEERKRAQFYARLASVPKLDGLRTSEIVELFEDMQGLGFFRVSDPSSIRNHLKRVNPSLKLEDETPEHLAQFREMFLESALRDIHQYAHHLINALLGKGQVDTTFGPLNATYLLLDRKTYRVRRVVKRADAQNEMLLDLLDLVQQRNFPFRRCPRCHVVFVPVKNQKYCSSECAYRATEEARKEKKRKYMRTYMATRRKRQVRKR